VIASLNHPNICTLHDVGPNYLVMEFVEGPTLAERIERGPVPLEESLAIGGQIADALEAAHERGIVHRDLKPGNVKVKSDGTVKVLDFGLAKMADPPKAGERTEDSPTLTLDSATRTGVILGTAAYMSPEQVRGKSVDKRADIWAFGVVLYEMFTGQRLFEGETVSDTLIQVATKEPEMDTTSGRAGEKCTAPCAPLFGERPEAPSAGHWRSLVCVGRGRPTLWLAAKRTVQGPGSLARLGCSCAVLRHCRAGVLHSFSRKAAGRRVDPLPDPRTRNDCSCQSQPCPPTVA
jgi:serine/threonine protein kinase